MSCLICIICLSIAVIIITLSMTHWRVGVKGCLYFLPFAGIVSLLFYPAKLPLLFKDILFIIPAYVGFVLTRRKIYFPKIIVFLLSLFSMLAVVQLYNPNLLNLFMGFIGLKVWLFYIPILFMAFHLVDSKKQLIKLIKGLVMIALIPCVIGIIQAILIYSGLEDYAYKIYGKAAGPATQQFAKLFIGSGYLVRIPSTFSFVTQYTNFTMCMIPLAYMLGQTSKHKMFGKIALLIIVIASLLSGARSMFLFVPLILVLIYGFHKGFYGVSVSVFAIGIPFISVAIYLFGGIVPIWKHMVSLVVHYWETIIIGFFVYAINVAPFGMGTGMNTGPARHAFVNSVSAVPMMENYYAKTVYELGLFGLFLLILIYFVLIYKGYSIHKKIQDKELKALSAGLITYLMVIIIQSVKGWSLDLDPANVYFWLYSGILMKLEVISKNNKNRQDNKFETS